MKGRLVDSNCSICKSNALVFDGFVRCIGCGTVRTAFSYSSDLYDKKYVETYQSYARGDINTPLNLFRLGQLSCWLKSDKASILDFGCCIGEFIRFAEKFYPCIGFDPNKDAVRIAQERCRSAIVSSVEELPQEKFEAITLFDVIEHIQNPARLLSFLKEHFLAKDGVMMFTTPNVGCIQLEDFSRLLNWKHYKPKEHLYLFGYKGLDILVKSIGCQTVYLTYEESKIRPGNPNLDILTLIAK